MLVAYRTTGLDSIRSSPEPLRSALLDYSANHLLKGTALDDLAIAAVFTESRPEPKSVWSRIMRRRKRVRSVAVLTREHVFVAYQINRRPATSVGYRRQTLQTSDEAFASAEAGRLEHTVTLTGKTLCGADGHRVRLAFRPGPAGRNFVTALTGADPTPEPPWVYRPSSRPYDGRWRQGYDEVWFLEEWLPFWLTADPETRAAYLERFPAPDNEWLEYLTEKWVPSSR